MMKYLNLNLNPKFMQNHKRTVINNRATLSRLTAPESPKCVSIMHYTPFIST